MKECEVRKKKKTERLRDKDNAAESDCSEKRLEVEKQRMI